ncbi:MAG: T9SS type A sorting domain-containing protein [Calditrichaeota bacterium]|nr:T9SS type A sorting domain-containing protein [Calditrichota bacterium]MCB9369174.1 T9SS type A sorting domain-containing protein [Calditrichota bacterium]
MNKMKILFVAAALMMMLGLTTQKANAWCNPGEVYCGFVVDSNVTVGHDDVERYRDGWDGPYCTPGGVNDRWRGKAHVYRIHNPGNPFVVTLDWNDNPNTDRDDLILVVLEDCDANKCLGSDPHTLEFSSENGNEIDDNDSNGIWIIVDSRKDTTTAYTLNIYCGDFPFSVELSSFTATRVGEGVSINWSTASETDNDHFEVSRRAVGEETEWMTIGVVGGNGTTSSEHHYSVTDNSAGNGSYYYMLQGFDVNGSVQEYGTAYVEGVVETAPVVETFGLLGNYPNPFNPSTNIRFSLAETSDITLTVYDVQGRIVTELANGTVEAGVHELSFDASGLTSGVYFAQLSGSFGSDVMKMVLMK